MLKYLHIENIAVIESADIDFSSGFNVLTGETGAGKSILIDSINAVLGERTSKDLIRAGCDSAVVSAIFGDISPQNVKSLNDLDIFLDDDLNLVISRRISLTGKNLIKINGIPATATTLRDIAYLLIDIHGQHDNQFLLNPEKHCGFIDAVAENSDILNSYYQEFKTLNSIRKELNSLEDDEEEKTRKISLLKHEINELETADIKLNETEDLKQKLSVAESFEKTYKSLNQVSSLLTGYDETDGAITLLRKALKELNSIKADEFSNITEEFTNAVSLVEDTSSVIFDKLESLDVTDYNIDYLNERLDFLSKLKHKYGNSEEKMLEYLENAKIKLQNIEFSEKRIEELSTDLENSKLRLIDAAKKLTESRINAGSIFEKNVTEVLKYLNMPDIRFKVSINQSRYTKNGCDDIEFLISANKGEELKPLAKIASGGELSRIMLAIKSALLDKDNVDTMIFDEIDSGISGYAADKVANQLLKVSENHQVICVTHLAQIAAKANNHLLISKNTQNDRTYTKVNELSYEDRINEIARIMSGTEITENLYNSAKELLDRR